MAYAERTPTLQDLVSEDLNFKVWSAMMKATLKEKGLWEVVENGIPLDPSKNPKLAASLQGEEFCRWRDLARKDMEALRILHSGLTDSVFRKTLSAATSAKCLWEMLEQVPEHLYCVVDADDLTSYDENMWMIDSTTTNHMTPHEEYFTTLDRTRRARVTFLDGSTIMAKGTGDVRILTCEGIKKTIKNVLFVPGIVRNALSVGQLNTSGYEVIMGTKECTIWDQAIGTLIGQTRSRKERGFFLRLKVI